ncbi:MAG TPA: hypothetical protein VG498_19030, partial [Terriglobales bacterium]|nr:hypothetical protein [Terriglobales bacterium]
MMRAFQLALRPTRRQSEILSILLSHLAELYNLCLEQRRMHWRQGRKPVSYYEQQAELKDLRAQFAEYSLFPVCVQRDPLRRVQRAYEGFFRRCRQGNKPGYPRFRS